MLFIAKEKVMEIQKRAIDEFGGLHGIRDEGGLESALMAVENRHYYENADIAGCAATYGFHITKAHAFIDGNKRTAAAVMLTFLIANGAQLSASEDQLYDFFISIAESSLSRDQAEEKLRSWIIY